MRKKLSLILVISFLFLNIFNTNFVLAVCDIYPSYSNMYLNEDKHEKINRKIFNMNLKLNKIFAKNVHILWVSIFPEFVVNSLNRAYSNIEYPKRLVSSLMQKDFEAVKNESKRFLINTTLGVGGLFDAAYKIFHLEMFDEDMEQALTRCKMKCGNYLVLPFISSATTRDLTGRILDFLLTPTTYIASPIAAAIKMGLLINRTAYIQPMIKMVESNFPDPYDIARKVYGVEKYIKQSNYDRTSVIQKLENDYDEIDLVDNKTLENLEVKGKVSESENLILDDKKDNELTADIFLDNYNPQYPVLDSMRTALLDLRDTKKSIWSEMAIWNRCFNKKIKNAAIEISANRPKYNIKYILRKEKTSPLVILFPSVGEGVSNSHSAILAKMFYDEGYSVIILGSHFQWEFLKSVEKGHKPGLIKEDIKFVNKLIDNSIDYLSKKYDRVFLNRTALGTSLGAYTVMFLGNLQYETGANNIDKFIAICPPYELTYAIKQMDKIIDCWKNYPDDFKQKAALTTAKVMKAFKEKEELNKNFTKLPFSNYEAKLISAFVFHQKLADLIYQAEIEENPNKDKKEIYELIYNTNFSKYIEKNFLVNNITLDELSKMTSFETISNYLKEADNYRIYHSLDDYLTEKSKLKDLRTCCKDKLTLFNNGSHLGFLYRDEFINHLRNEIKIKN